MKGKTRLAWLLLVVALCTSLWSVPAFSGEHPWDVDRNGPHVVIPPPTGGGSGNGSVVDTTRHTDSTSTSNSGRRTTPGYFWQRMMFDIARMMFMNVERQQRTSCND